MIKNSFFYVDHIEYGDPYPEWLYRLGLYETRYILFPNRYYTPEEMESNRESHVR